MGREKCSMIDWIDGKAYCAYQDYGCFLCTNHTTCPEELDDDDGDDEYIDDELDDINYEIHG